MPEKRKISVYISGAHSVGKTTLHETLLKNHEFSKFKFLGQKEVARQLLQANGYTQEMLQDPAILLRIEYEMLFTQLQNEESECSNFNGRFLWDRGIIDPLVYTKLFCEKTAVDDMFKISAVQTALSRLRRNEDTVIFVLKPQKEFVEFDGVRPDSDLDELLQIHDGTIKMLNELAIPHTVVEKSNLKERVRIVLNTVKKKWPFLSDTNGVL